MDLSAGPVLLTTAYLPPVHYFSKFTLNRTVLLEQHENYQKQSYRNRCHIFGANGCQTLVIPVTRQGKKPCRISDVRIDHEKKWQKNHWKAIESAYRLSPWFEFYADDLAGFYQRKTELLFEWNLLLIRFFAGILELKVSIGLTGSFIKPEGDPADFRYTIHPKEKSDKTDGSFRPQPYPQVFTDKFGFIPNLSIIDLVFNEGPHALKVIRESVITY